MIRALRALTVLGTAAALVFGACDRGADRAGGAPLITVVIAEYSKDHTRPFWQGLADQYTKQSGSKVDLRIIDWNSIDQQVSTMLQSNQPPDVLNLNSFSSYAKDQLLYPADDVLSPKTREDFIGAFARGGEYQGKLYGFPILSSARAFFYKRISSPAPVSRARPGPGTSSCRPRARSRRSATASSATRCRSAPRRRRPSGRSGCGTTAATGNRATPGPSTATRTCRPCSSWPTSPTVIGSRRSIPERPTAPTARSSSSRTARWGW